MIRNHYVGGLVYPKIKADDPSVMLTCHFEHSPSTDRPRIVKVMKQSMLMLVLKFKVYPTLVEELSKPWQLN